MSTNPEDPLEPRDQQQAKLVDSLRAAAGAPVGFDELRELGIERPAVVCYELEAAGLPITLTRAPDGRSTGARLDEPEPEEPAPTPNDWPSRLPALDVETVKRRLAPRIARVGRGAAAVVRARARTGSASVRRSTRARHARAWLAGRTRRARQHPRVRTAGAPMLAAVALLAAFAVTAILVITSPGWGGHPATRARAQVRGSHGTLAEPAPRRSSPTPGGGAAPVPPASVQGAPVKVSPADAAALQATGHQQLAGGRYPQAIGSLLAAIRAGGQSLSGCTEPTTEACLTFAYALYDLGRALRLDGDPSAAVPVLRERLRIHNQRPVVEQELQLARGGSV
jgi:hypothetical protein